SDELNQVNSFLQAILASLRGAVVVVNRDLVVLVWSVQAEDLWGLRADEVVGKPLLNLDIGLPVTELKGPIRACLTGDGDTPERTRGATNRRGKTIRCKVTCRPLVGRGGDQRGHPVDGRGRRREGPVTPGRQPIERIPIWGAG